MRYMVKSKSKGRKSSIENNNPNDFAYYIEIILFGTQIKERIYMKYKTEINYINIYIK